ncbi:TBC1 domain family member 24-like isoform X2 [Gambusia affinis]|uniref:TBC1 domain family member 24-like isoform X2 n=1 Tax=Gambusia affinis TaxID=33528 RepID=UPI001CDC8A16|nr:TBC1 domain family member 24-like isoform X2 [Gambusia affinis]
MIHVSRTPEFSNFGNMNMISFASPEQDVNSLLTGRRPRSRSYNNPEDSKNCDFQVQTEELNARPRSRSFYSYETSELCSNFDTENFSWSCPLKQRASSQLRHQMSKINDKDGNQYGFPVNPKKSKSKKLSKDLNGSKGSARTVSMITISESDNWEICSSSGMKYGQFVDWEKIDPEPAKKYQQILKSGHQQLKRMGREGFWATSHTLRAKAYYHVIHNINSRAITPDRDVYYEMAKKLFGEQKVSTHQVPEYMEDGDLPRCCRGIRKLIASSHQNLFEFYSDWIMWIFADLPFTYAIRVLDVYLLEGFKVLFRVALALLDLYKVSVSSRVADVEDFRTDMKRFVQSVTRHCTAEKLLERAFQIPIATRNELNLLFNANKDALKQKGVSTHQKRQTVESVDLSNFSSSVVTVTEMRVIWAWIPERFALFNPVRLFHIAEHGRNLSSLYSRVEGHEPIVLIIKTMDEEVFGAFLSTDLMERRNHDSQGLTYFGTGECFVFVLRPSMERYQRAMVNIMTRIASPQQHRNGSSSTSQLANSSKSQLTTKTVSCTNETPQNPSYLTLPLSAPLGNPRTAKEAKRPKEQDASNFIAGDNSQLIIGGDGGHALCLCDNLEEGNSEPCDTFSSNPLCKGHFQIQSLEVWGIQNSIYLSHSFHSQ